MISALQGLSFEQAQALLKLEEEFPELREIADIKAKRAYIGRKKAEMLREIEECETDVGQKRKQLNFLERKQSALGEMIAWECSGIKLEKPDGISFRRLRKAVKDGETAYIGTDVYEDTPAQDLETEVFRQAEILVIEHDWSAALGSVTDDVTAAVIRLPFDVCAFEFRYSGHPVIALATQIDTNILFTPAILFDGVWLLFDFMIPLDGMRPEDERNCIAFLLDDLGTQIKAACIALDAEVAESNPVREPHRGGQGNYQRPPKPYHVVSLANRAKRAPSLALAAGEDSRRVRLHFRRGHWRHFEDHKTWIKWMLVGDPDLGFVEKHYRL